MTIKLSSCLSALAVAIAFPAPAAETPTPTPTPLVATKAPSPASVPDVAEEMRKLGLLAGEWKGESWMILGPQRRTSVVTESVQWKQNGRLLVIEGLGKRNADRPEDQVTVHEALGVVFHDASSNRYLFHAYRDGAFIESELQIIADGRLEWGFRDPRSGGRIRFMIDVTVPNRWLETGEFSADEKTWKKFFEMTLHRTR